MIKKKNKKEKKKKKINSGFYCPSTHSSMLKLPVASPLKKMSLPHMYPYKKPSTMESYSSESLSQFLRVLFGGFLLDVTFGVPFPHLSYVPLRPSHPFVPWVIIGAFSL